MESSLRETRKRSGSEENLTITSPKKAKVEDVQRQQEEDNFVKLHTIVLDTVINRKNVSDEDISNTIPIIINSFTSFKFLRIVDLSKWEYSCAYFYRYGSHGAGLTRYKVIEALQNCGDLASKFKESDLNIISLGGGPGNDVIGLCSALYQSEVKSRLNITTVDSVHEWSSYVTLFTKFVKERDFGNVSKLFHHNDVNFNFIQAHLPGNSVRDKKYFHELRKADVILMTKFLSILDLNESDIVESVFKEMKNGAFILFIDSPFRKELWSKFEILYGGLNPQKSESSQAGREEDNLSYFSLANAENRFKSNDHVSSKARLVVLRKK